MEELQKPWGDRNVYDWYESDDNNTMIAIPLGADGVHLNLVDALSDIRTAVQSDKNDLAIRMLNNLGEIIVLTSKGLGVEAAEELIVDTTMESFDEDLNNFLDGHAED